jgi:hypothetical protein
MIQTPMVGLVSVALWQLISGVSAADGVFAALLAWLSRTATLVFLVYYTALDSIGGTGLGRLLLNTQWLASPIPHNACRSQLPACPRIRCL